MVPSIPVITRILEKSQTKFGSKPDQQQFCSKLWVAWHWGMAGGFSMIQIPGEGPAAQRARWLAELSEALDQARYLMKALGAAEGRLESVELYARIEAVRLEIEAIRLGRRYASREEFDPMRIGFSPPQGRYGNGS